MPTKTPVPTPTPLQGIITADGRWLPPLSPSGSSRLPQPGSGAPPVLLSQDIENIDMRAQGRELEQVWKTQEQDKDYLLSDQLNTRTRRAAPPTVYRALEFLCREGLVHKIESLNAYVGCGAPGHASAAQFLICRACGTAAEIAALK